MVTWWAQLTHPHVAFSEIFRKTPGASIDVPGLLHRGLAGVTHLQAILRSRGPQ
jgi:hypothetical protein